MKPRHVEVAAGDLLLLIGTMKGLFLARSPRAKGPWQLGGPYFPGHPVYAVAYDDRAGRTRLWAAATSPHFGTVLHASDDFGRRWTAPESAPIKFPEGSDAALKQIWQISPGPPEEPDTLYCGVEPAALFASRDAGATWTLVRGLFDHPHRPRWQPGGGGLCLHTILPDPQRKQRMLVAISSGGVYRTEDGGRTWEPSNKGIRAEFLPDKHPEFGQCVHKMVRHPSRPERIFLQNHWGLYRSDDGGRSWKDVANGVPSDFGFAMAMHPHEPDTVYVVPLEADEFRVTPDGRLRVYRTRDAGRSWHALTRGLPQEGAFETVIRDAMATAPTQPAGVYFGTRSGRVWGSRNNGDSWQLIHGGLPPVTCVRAVLAGPRPSRVRSSRGGEPAAPARRPAARRAGRA